VAKFKGSVLQCGECGRDFSVPPNRSKTAKYCSKECADGHRSDSRKIEKIEKSCQRCGTLFTDHPCHSGRRKYCSYKCANQSAVKEETRVCGYCGDVFTVNPSSPNICCSWECRIARAKSEYWPTSRKLLKQCVRCGKEFWRQLSRVKKSGGKYCSPKCKINSQKLDVMSPGSFYGSGVWYQARNRILARDGFKCQHCGFAGKSLHVHHKELKRNGGAESDDNLITLCASCHRLEHWKMEQ
jgi:hypothetical protein